MHTDPPTDTSSDQTTKKRTRLVRQYPVHTLDEASSIAATIQRANAGLPFDRQMLAKAMNTTPASSGFRMKLNSSIKYGLTKGGYNDHSISLTTLGAILVAPTHQKEREQVLREAAVYPELFMRFYQILDKKQLPDDPYAENMLHRELGIDRRLTEECLYIIKSNGIYAGILTEADGTIFVNLAEIDELDQSREILEPITTREPSSLSPPNSSEAHIFIGHAGNSTMVKFLLEMFESFGISTKIGECDFDPDRAISADLRHIMLSCTAAIIVFASHTDSQWDGRREDKRLQKLLFQLGGASVLFGDKVISLKERSFTIGDKTSVSNTLEYHGAKVEEVGLKILKEFKKVGVINIIS